MPHQSQKQMVENPKLLNEYSVTERSAYLTAITALATADRTATEDETYLLEAIAESAQLPPDEAALITSTAGEATTDEALKQSLDILKGSDLRFSLMTDLLAFAESDQHVSPEEKAQLQVAARHLNIDEQQYSTINQFVNKAVTTPVTAYGTTQPQNFLESLGMGDVFKKTGMDFNKISGGLLGSLGPLLGNLVGQKTGTNSGAAKSGGPGDMLGGLSGNDSGKSGSGGFGSLISKLNGGKGLGSIGNMLERVFGK